jgi:hypothetical protein
VKFFDSLLQDIDLCQLEATERRFQIGWCSPIYRGMNVSWLLLVKADRNKDILLFIFLHSTGAYTKNNAAGFIELFIQL